MFLQGLRWLLLAVIATSQCTGLEICEILVLGLLHFWLFRLLLTGDDLRQAGRIVTRPPLGAVERSLASGSAHADGLQAVVP